MSGVWEDPKVWTDPVEAIRIFRWADAPEHVREIVAAAVNPTWLAWVPDAKRTEAESNFGWLDTVRSDDPNGNLVVAGREPPAPEPSE